MNITVIGAGAMGSLLGFYLSSAANVTLLDPWRAHVDAINAAGLRCEHDGTEDVRRLRATTSTADAGPCDIALVLVKAQQTPWAAQQAQIINPRLLAMTLQNGVGNSEALATVLGAERVGQGVTSLGATLLGPGHVRHAGHGPTVFGSAPNAEAAQALAALFTQCGLPAECTDDLDALVWGKLLVNVGINALTALLQVPNGVLAEEPTARSLLELAVAEAAAVAAARGVALPYADPLEHVLEVARVTGANRSSMLQDVLRGNPTEIATINGAVAGEGARLGIDTPMNTLLTALVTALDASRAERVGS